MTNYTASHETRTKKLGTERVDFPDNHIEADNRLSWFLGRLDRRYGDNAFYVHLKRNELDTARSYARRWDKGIIKAYRRWIILGGKLDVEPVDMCLDYCETVNSNIEAFLKDKTRKLTFNLENAKEDYRRFWELDAALAEWDVNYNASKKEQPFFKRLINGKSLGS
jgi:hypothetical protein